MVASRLAHCRRIGLVTAFAVAGAACAGGSDQQTVAPASTGPGPTAASGDGSGGDDTLADGSVVPATDHALDDALDLPANPASVDLVLDQASAISANIGASGGTVSATGPDGTEYTLDIAQGALFSDVEITITPITGASGEAVGETFIAGVELQPSGLHLLGDATLSIASNDIEEAVGWGSDAGEDFHLTPSEHAGGTATIPVFHFSDFGLAKQQIRNLVQAQGIVPEDTDALISHILTIASDEIAIQLATDIAEALSISGAPSGDPAADYAVLERLSSDVVTHVGRIIVSAVQRGWGPDTPGYDELQTAFYGLVNSWFALTDDLMVAQMELCEDGHLEAGFRLLRQALIGSYLLVLDAVFDGGADADYVGDISDSYLTPWADAGVDCLALGMTWQARIITTGSGFRSDISIGAEARNVIGEEFDSVDWLISRQGGADGESQTSSIPSQPIETALEVEWLDGFFADPILGCNPADGTVEMQFEDLDVHVPNLGNFGDVTIDPTTPFFVRVRVIEPITIECTPGFGIGGEAGYPFHLGALEHLNGIFDVSGNWYFQMYYEPGGGEVGRFEQGFPIEGEGVILDAPQLEFPTGKYELWQLATVFQPQPPS